MFTKSRILAGGLLTILGVLGCSRGLPDVEGPIANGGPGQPLPVSEVDLSTAAESLDLAELLKAPRAELAQRCEDLEKTIRRQEQFRLEGKLNFALLPHLRLPLVVPVFRDAAYSTDRGFSLPPYLKVDSHDSAVAFHLARHGDQEAALKLVDRGDTDAEKLIRDAATEKQYPLEWTRLVALLMHSNQVALAADNKDGAKNLISLHKQLRDVLDDKAKAGPLGTALLSRGFATLRKAAAAWKAINRDDLELQINVCLASFNDVPPYSIVLPRTVDGLMYVFAAKAGPNAVIASSSDRVADLLNIYLPTNEADTCVAFADATGRPNELLLTFRPHLFDFNTPEQFAEPLEDFVAGRKDDVSSDCPRRIWDIGSGRLDLTLTPRHPTLGAVATLKFPGGAKPVDLSRDFGPVHLDRTFEGNRRLTTWTKRGNCLTLVDQAMTMLPNPLKPRTLATIVIDREPKHDLVSKVTFDYLDTHKDVAAAGSIARPLFWTSGRAEFAFGPAGSGDIEFVWADAKTRYRLHFPYAREKLINLDVADNTGADIDGRAKAATEKDARDRLDRIEASRPLAMLPRELDGVRLGMTRADFKKALPKTGVVEREIPGGVMAAYLGSAPKVGNAVAREWFARFDNDSLAELRIRYVDLPGNKPGTFTKKVEMFRSKLGAPEVGAVTNGLWTDLPKRGQSATYTWHDDLTLLTCRQEPHGLEVVLRDCPPQHAAGTPLPNVEYIGRGTMGVKLGMTADELVKAGGQPTEGNAYLVTADSQENFDHVLAWIENGKVTRIAARHKLTTPVKAEPQASKTVLDQWARDSRSIGWPARQDMVGPNLQSLANRDDNTRFRIYWQEEPNGLSVFSEWKDAK